MKEPPSRSGDATLERSGDDAGDRDADAMTGAVPAAPLEGRTIAHFHIVERLGAGGMGVVYKAIDQKLRRSVAIKFLAPQYGIDDRNRAILVREARSAASLTHPNIAAIHEVHDGADGAFFVMELVEGETLRARIARAGAIDLREALRWALAIARALARAHEAGIVHRDLKTENVMLTPGGELKLLDFGLAKIAGAADPETTGLPAQAPSAHALAPTVPAWSRTTEHGRVMGTPAYMAPEQARGEPVDARADVFAFGVVLYEMLTGRMPFAHRAGPPWTWGDAASGNWTPRERVRAAAGGVPKGVEQLVNRCLAFEASERFADGGELAAAIEARALAASRSKGGRGGRVAVIALVSVGCLAAFGWGTRRARSGAATTSVKPASSEGALDAPLPLALIPGSVTNDQAARDAFRLAMQELGGGAASVGSRLDEAIARDPAFASAHLQRAYVEYRLAEPDLETMRRHLAQASATKGALPARDAELLDALLPASSDPQDWAEVQRRLRAMTARWSGDTQVWEALGLALAKSPNAYEEALHAFERASVLDPAASFGLGIEAQIALAQGDDDRARRALDECIRRAPAAVDCRYTMLAIVAAGGDCEALDRAARQMVASAPDSPVGYEFRANAQAALHAPIEVVDALLAQRRARQPSSYRAESERLDAIRLALWSGDFGAAAERAELAEKAGDASEVLAARELRICALREMGKAREAGRLALDMLHREAALPRDDELADDWTIWMLVAAHRAGAVSDADFERERGAWKAGWQARLGEDAWRANGPFAWWYSYAEAADTERAARDAIAHLADFGPLPRAGNTLFVYHDEAIGETYRLAGDLDEAAARLEAATRVCALPSSDMGIVPAYLGLGRLRERRGDVSGACSAYAQVLTAWGHARPRSITADGARAAAARLRCQSATFFKDK